MEEDEIAEEEKLSLRGCSEQPHQDNAWVGGGREGVQVCV